MTAYTARWTPLGTRWALTIEDGTRVVRFRRTDVPAGEQRPGDEHLGDLGFGACPGGSWEPEPAGWQMPVEPVSREFAAELAGTLVRDRGLPGS